MPQLSVSPGRIAPNDGAWNASRKPLVGEFTYAGRTLFVVGNHFNSKGGDEPLFGRFQPPHRSSEVQRHQQATLVNAFVGQITAIDPAADVIVAGDFNDFAFSETLHVLEGTQLVNMFDTLPPEEQYDYVFEGNAQTLDHILVSPALEADRQGRRSTSSTSTPSTATSSATTTRSCCRWTSRRSPAGGTSPTAPTGCSTPACPAAAVGSRPASVRELPLGAPGLGVGIVAQVTVVNPDHDGWLKVFPCGQPEPVSTAVNYKAGTGAWAGQVTIATGNGSMCFSTYSATDVVVDRSGWLVSERGAGYTPVAPYRLVDTARSGRRGAARRRADPAPSIRRRRRDGPPGRPPRSSSSPRSTGRHQASCAPSRATSR